MWCLVAVRVHTRISMDVLSKILGGVDNRIDANGLLVPLGLSCHLLGEAMQSVSRSTYCTN